MKGIILLESEDKELIRLIASKIENQYEDNPNLDIEYFEVFE